MVDLLIEVAPETIYDPAWSEYGTEHILSVLPSLYGIEGHIEVGMKGSMNVL